MAYEILLHARTQQTLDEYSERLRKEGISAAGALMADRLKNTEVAAIDQAQVLDHLVNTKKPRIFAESEVYGDGRDWTLEELSLLGGINIATPVTVFDDGTHLKPQIHALPFQATLLFVAGALLRNGRGVVPADWDQVVGGNRIDVGQFSDLYEMRLYPALKYANDEAARNGKRAFVTIPGIGCGQFAGQFQGQLAIHLQTALIALLERHLSDLTNIAVLYFDPYNECSSDTKTIGPISFRTRPLLNTQSPKPQLLHPTEYQEGDDDFSDCELFSVVAWDHVSWPGNDFYVGMRATDDGVKAAATSAMTVMTGCQGQYDKRSNCYVPDKGFRNWKEVVVKNGIKITAAENTRVYS